MIGKKIQRKVQRTLGFLRRGVWEEGEGSRGEREITLGSLSAALSTTSLKGHKWLWMDSYVGLLNSVG